MLAVSLMWGTGALSHSSPVRAQQTDRSHTVKEQPPMTVEPPASRLVASEVTPPNLAPEPTPTTKGDDSPVEPPFKSVEPKAAACSRTDGA